MRSSTFLHRTRDMLQTHLLPCISRGCSSSMGVREGP